MGSNPSKSQQLQSMFPEYRIMAELSLNPTNCYELIYVTKGKTNEIYTIKQSTKEPISDVEINKYSNVLQALQTKKIDSMYYTLYQWIPHSLEKFLSVNSQLVNKNFTSYLVHTLVKIYSMLWKTCEGNGLDIASDNIRAVNKGTHGVIVKVFPPNLTFCSFPQRKVLYRNRINDLGEALYSIFKGKHHQTGVEVMNFINNRMRGSNIITNAHTWQQLQKDSKFLVAEPEISAQELNNLKYIRTPAKYVANSQRPVSPIPPNQNKSQYIVQKRSVSPIGISNTYGNQNSVSPSKIIPSSSSIIPNIPVVVSRMVPYGNSGRDLSPQISRVSIYENSSRVVPSSQSPIQTHNPINQYRRYPHANGNGTNPSPLKYNSVPNISVSPNKYSSKHVPQIQNNPKGIERNVHQYNEALAFHQNPINTGINNQSVYQTLVITSQTQLQNTQPQHQLISPSPIKYEKVSTNTGQNGNSNIPNYGRNENMYRNVSHFNTNYYTGSQTKYNHNMNVGSTPKERNFNINGPIQNSNKLRNYETEKKLLPNVKPIINQMGEVQRKETKIKMAELPINKIQKPNMEQLKNIKPQVQAEPPIRISKIIPIPPLFQPSARDPLQIRPKLGVPNINYSPKTKEDKHETEEYKKENNKSSLNFRMEEQNGNSNFLEKHLIVKNNGGINAGSKMEEINSNELLGSSIPIAVDKSSSFGLTISQDSEAGHYQGIYEGGFHPNYPTVRHGVGKLIFPSGGTYQGNFSWNKMDGWGKLFYPSGRLAYQGYWKNSKFEGYGKLFNENPLHIEIFDYTNFNKIQQVNSEDGYWKYYQGNMKNDMKQGHGIWVLQNGEKYDGEFHHDMAHGNGVFYSKKGKIEGIWENNVLVKVLNTQ